MIGLGLSVYKSKISSTGGGGGSSYTPPLDLYPADIAYSVRKLSSSYSGFCMEVQRVSDAATQDIGFDSDGLVDVDALAAFSSGSDLRVRTWYDQTGNGRHAQTTVAGDMSYIYSSGAVEQANEVPVVNPRGATDGRYDIVGTYSTSSNNTVFSVLSAGAQGGSYLLCRPVNGSAGVLGAGIAEPIGGWNSNIDYGFGTTQYYRDGAFYGTGTTLQRNDIMQSAISSQRIFGVGFTQSSLTSLIFGRNSSSSIYATQEFIVYFSDQLGTTPRQALEQNLNSYYQSSNLPDYTSGFLADYPNAAAAYSVRQLSNTAIKCMRVRRAVAPFDEQDIGFDSNGDLDTSSIIAFGGSDVLTVSVWYDQSGQSNHAMQITSGSQPHIYDGTAVLTENGKPIISRVSSTTGFSPIAADMSGSTISVSSVSLQTTTAGIMVWFGTNLTERLYTATSGTTLTDGGSAGFNTTSAELFWNGVSQGSSATRGETYTQFINNQTLATWVGLTDLAGTQFNLSQNVGYWQMHNMQEIVFWESDQSSNRTAIETNTNLYYGVYTMYNYEPATSGFLFDYPDAEAAYSVRQLNNNATVSMRVRRTVSPFDEQDIGFDGSGNLDEAAISTFGGSDPLTVSVWYDQSGQQKHATQITAGNQPQIYNGTSVITNPDNSLPVLDCTVATGAGFSSVPISINGTMTYSMVSFFDASEGGGYTSNGSFKVAISNSTGNVTLVGGGNTAVTDSNLINDGSVHHMVRTTSSAGTLVVNTANVQSSSNTASGTSSWSINNYLGNRRTTDNVAHELQEFIVWPSDQLITNQSGIETNINDYFEIIVNDEAATSGFLFDYPNAAVAYSVRQLNNNATYSMRVERSDGRTLNIGFDGNGDLDTQAIIDFAGASVATVRRWFDQTGNQNHARLSQNPVIIYDGTSIISRSGIPAVQNGTNVGCMQFSNIGIPSSGGYTTFAAKGAQSNWGGVITGGWYPRSSTQGWIVSGNTTIDNFSNSGLFDEMVMTSRKDGNDYDMWRNTTSLYSNTLGTAYVGGPFVDLFRGEAGDPNSIVDDGLLHEAIFYDSALPDATVTNIQNNLITQYSL